MAQVFLLCPQGLELPSNGIPACIFRLDLGGVRPGLPSGRGGVISPPLTPEAPRLHIVPSAISSRAPWWHLLGKHQTKTTETSRFKFGRLGEGILCQCAHLWTPTQILNLEGWGPGYSRHTGPPFEDFTVFQWWHLGEWCEFGVLNLRNTSPSMIPWE